MAGWIFDWAMKTDHGFSWLMLTIILITFYIGVGVGILLYSLNS